MAVVVSFSQGVNLWKPTCLFHSLCPTCRSWFEDSVQCYFSDHTKKKRRHKNRTYCLKNECDYVIMYEMLDIVVRNQSVEKTSYLSIHV